jgi:hypothetical protein
MKSSGSRISTCFLGLRNTYLLFWGFHSATSIIDPAIASPADHIAFILYWAGLVCLGFPLWTLGGVRGGGGDSLLDLRTPVLFVVGERAAGSTPHDLEDLRQQQNLLLKFFYIFIQKKKDEKF